MTLPLEDIILTLNQHDRAINDLETQDNLPIVARYTKSGGTASHTSTTTIDYDTKVYDTWDAVTVGGSWVFTAPIGGYYLAQAMVYFVAATAPDAGERAFIRADKNGSLYGYIDFQDFIDKVATSVSIKLQGSLIVYLAKDDTLTFKVFQESGSTLTFISNHDLNHCSIARLG